MLLVHKLIVSENVCVFNETKVVLKYTFYYNIVIFVIRGLAIK